MCLGCVEATAGKLRRLLTGTVGPPNFEQVLCRRGVSPPWRWIDLDPSILAVQSTPAIATSQWTDFTVLFVRDAVAAVTVYRPVTSHCAAHFHR